MQNALILIIDTSPETRAMYAEYFRYHGYNVAEAADASEGVRLFQQLQPNLVITELSDETEWLQAIRILRWPETGGKTAFIACSTWIDAKWPVVPQGIDVDVALPKPTSPRTLLLEAEHLLDRQDLTDPIRHEMARTWAC